MEGEKKKISTNVVDNHVQFFYLQGQSQPLDENNFAFYNI